MTAEQFGGYCANVLFAVPSLALFVAAALAKTRPKALSRASLGCGLAVFPLGGLVVTSRELPNVPQFFPQAVGGVTVLAAVLGIVFAVASLAARHRPPGRRPIIGPIFGILFSLLGVCSGSGMMLLPSATTDRGTPWVYTSDEHQFQVTLPSEQWRVGTAKGAGEIVRFVRPQPAMVTSVVEVQPASTEAEYSAVVAAQTKRFLTGDLKPIENQSGTNAGGQPYWYMLGRENTRSGFVVGVSVTWVDKRRAVVVIFEGQIQMLSKFGQEQEERTFRSSATSIFTSVKGRRPGP